jgi:hypothetical protein
MAKHPAPGIRSITTILALTIAAGAGATALPTITTKATGWDSPSATSNIDLGGTIPSLALAARDQKVGDWYRREWNDADYDVQAEKEVGDSVFTAGDRCLLDADNASLQGTQPNTIGGYPYRTGPQVEAISSDDYVATVPTSTQIPVPAALDFVSSVRFLTGGARIATSDYTVRFHYATGVPATNDIVVPIALDSVTGAARNSAGTNYTTTSIGVLTNNTTVVWDAGAPAGTDCTGAGGDQVVVTNPDSARRVSAIEFIYTDYSPTEVEWLGGPFAVALESDQAALEATYDYVGTWSSSVTTADAPVDMPAHSDTALWYRFDYTATIPGNSAIFVHFQCANDDSGNGTLAGGELSVEEVHELQDGANFVDLTTVCAGRYVQYDVEIIDAYDDNPTLDAITFNYDADNDDDGFGATGDAGTLVDCRDNDNNSFPGAFEVVGNNVDNDCNGIEDCFVDADNDGFRLSTTDPGGSNNDADCNDANEAVVGDLADCLDSNAAVRPGVAELPGDNVDQNCDSSEDCYTDADNDGARLGSTVVGGSNGDADCNDANEGITADLTDCADGNAAINPGAIELKGDEVDQNCDTDELCWPDADADGDRANAGQVLSSDVDCDDAGEGQNSDLIDCNDAVAAIFSGAIEVAGDNVDQNCDTVENCFTDADDDGARLGTTVVGGSNSDADCNDPNEGITADLTDCVDNNAAINPSATEIKGDQVDQNCNGQELCWPDADNDNDRDDTGQVVSADADCTDANEGRTTDPVDCNDANNLINSGATEIPGDNVDQDCDNIEDCFTDADNDGARLTTSLTGGSNSDADCNDANEGVTADLIDCNDGVAAINPGATEIKGDEVDQDCDTDELCWPDGDGDNERANAGQVVSSDVDCDDAGEGQNSDPVDCNDGDAAINSLAAEIPGDNVDQNCNSIENCYTDADNDGARLGSIVVGGSNNDADCNDANEGLAADPTDCNDTTNTVSPLIAEVKGNDVDNDCNGGELCWPNVDNDTDRADAGQVVSADADCTDANEGQTTDPIDCDDTLATRASSNAETPGNNVDNNCDNIENCFTDADNDGNRLSSVVIGGSNNDADCLDANEGEATDLFNDCNDADSSVRQGSPEITGNNVDNNCDNVEDCFTDADNDNARTVVVVVGGSNGDADCLDANEGQLSEAIDCVDTNPLINPAAAEITGDSVDQNCNGQEVCFTDADNDGARLTTTVVSTDTDCNDNNEGVTGDAIDCVDTDAATNPAAAEIKGDEYDQNCDGQETCWPDLDNDDDRAGMGSVASADVDCDDVNEASTSQAVDCDDGTATRASRNAEITGNELDDNCDNIEKCFIDADNDSTRASAGTVDSVGPDFDCDDPGEEPTGSLVDCADNNADRSPLLNENGAYLANEVDNDCNGGEICMQDSDNDDYSTTNTVVSSDADCQDSGEDPASAGDDCNDGNAAVNPGEPDICGNGVDDNCNGTGSDHGGLAFDDDDGDTLDFAFESTYRFNGTGTQCLSDCDSDSDNDGVDDDDEVGTRLRTDPCDTDTDNDGLSDAVEIGPNVNAPLNTDGDGLIDALDPDDDNDGIPTSVERLAVANPDGDALQNYHDLDSDGDGWSDAYEWTEILTDSDEDNDGNDNYVDTDSDGDTFLDDDELGTESVPGDSDNDGIENRLDNDDDNDCVPTRDEIRVAGVLANTDADALLDYLDNDDDNDTLNSCQENPDNSGTPFADDTDGDTIPNFRDNDDDDDLIPTAVEVTINRPNCTTDDSIPTHLDQDSDNDGWTDEEESPGAVLVNTDGDADIDMCDLDSDQDRVTDNLETRGDTDGNGLLDRVDPDDDGDGFRTDLECGFPTACDTNPRNDDTDGDGVYNYLDTDDDGDGVDTEIERWDGGTNPATAANTDGDGLPDWADTDDDNDTVQTEDEDPPPADLDSDSLPNYRDDDDDGDSLLTAEEIETGTPLDFDFDGDTLPNFLDKDDDNDGKYTLCEVAWLSSVPPYHLNEDSDLDGLFDGQEWGATWGVAAPDDCSEPFNTDGADQYDVLDEDDDNDGILTYLETNQTEIALGQDDQDCLWTDDNSNGVVDDGEVDPIPVGDGIPAHRDLDTDNDGIPDGQSDPDDSSILENFGEDADGDGQDNIDDCDQTGCRGDSDGDGLKNYEETRACCRIYEVTADEAVFGGIISTNRIVTVCDQLDAGDYSECGCVLTNTRDFDLDGVIDPDEIDSLGAPQPDTDEDGLADVLDDDDDDDGLTSREENLYERATDCTLSQWDEDQVRETLTCSAVFRPQFDLANVQWAYRCSDSLEDAGELITFCDEQSNVDAPDAVIVPAGADRAGNPLARDTDTIANYLDNDDDGDGSLTRDEQTPNTDVDCDGYLNWFDRADDNGDCADADGDGISNQEERDLGSNEYGDDSDGDGLTDAQEYGDGSTPRDTDGDGVPDLLDADDDNDGVPTAQESQGDSDGDGTPDYLDDDSDNDGDPDGGEQDTDSDCDGIPDAIDPTDDGICDSGVTTLKYLRGSCSCDSSSANSSLALVFGALALVVRRRRQTS